jgi:hypothetical protein
VHTVSISTLVLPALQPQELQPQPQELQELQPQPQELQLLLQLQLIVSLSFRRGQD